MVWMECNRAGIEPAERGWMMSDLDQHVDRALAELTKWVGKAPRGAAEFMADWIRPKLRDLAMEADSEYGSAFSKVWDQKAEQMSQEIVDSFTEKDWKRIVDMATDPPEAESEPKKVWPH